MCEVHKSDDEITRKFNGYAIALSTAMTNAVKDTIEKTAKRKGGNMTSEQENAFRKLTEAAAEKKMNRQLIDAIRARPDGNYRVTIILKTDREETFNKLFAQIPYAKASDIFGVSYTISATFSGRSLLQISTLTMVEYIRGSDYTG